MEMITTSVFSSHICEGLGNFEENFNEQWFTATKDIGSIQIDTETSYVGDKSLRVDVDTPNQWKVRMFNTK